MSLNIFFLKVHYSPDTSLKKSYLKYFYNYPLLLSIWKFERQKLKFLSIFPNSLKIFMAADGSTTYWVHVSTTLVSWSVTSWHPLTSRTFICTSSTMVSWSWLHAAVWPNWWCGMKCTLQDSAMTSQISTTLLATLSRMPDGVILLLDW